MSNQRERNRRVKQLAQGIRISLLVLCLLFASVLTLRLFQSRAREHTDPAAERSTEKADIQMSVTDAVETERADAGEDRTGEEESNKVNSKDAKSKEAETENLQSKETESDKSQAAEHTDTAAQAAALEWAEKRLREMTLEQKVAQLFIVTPEALTGEAVVLTASETTREALTRYPVAGFIYFRKNLISREQIKEMLGRTAAYGEEIGTAPLFLCVDEEGGSVTRLADNASLGLPAVGDMAEIGKSGDASKAYDAGVTISTYLRELGFNTDFAPDADVLLNDANTVVKRRAFGSDGALVAEMVVRQMRAFSENQIFCTLKHFPGHGATSGDTHDGYAYTERTLEQMRACELLPFQKGIEEGVPFIMVGHLSAPQVTGDEKPCSLSYRIVTELLREEMQFSGIVITDAMNMGAISQDYTSAEASILAIEAGCDIILMPEDFVSSYEAVLRAVTEGRISPERIEESVLRILKVKGYCSLRSQ